MKLSLSQWGELLDAISTGEDKKEILKNLRAFVILLRKYRMLGKFSSILRAWERARQRRERILLVYYEGRFALQDDIRSELESLIKERTHTVSIHWKEKENQKLLGGAKIFFGGYLFDASIQTKFLLLREALEKN